MDNDIEAVRWLHTPRESAGEDYRFAGPVQECLCGCNSFHIVATFDSDGDIATYVLDGLCWSCGAVVLLPTAIRPNAFVDEGD